MARVVKDRGASGQGSIVFRQNMDYPRVPGQITYYPPEPSDELRNQVRKDKAGGLIVYIIGFAIVLMGYLGAINVFEIYAVLIPVLLLLGLVFAMLYLFMDNITLAKLSRTMPLVLMVCLVMLYIMVILSSIMASIPSEGSEIPSENDITDNFEPMLNPGIFFMFTGLMICRAGGTMLWTSTKILHEYIPGMIIIETPQQHVVASINTEPASQFVAPTTNIKLCSKCNKPLDYIEEYGRYYCYDCQEYAVKEL